MVVLSGAQHAREGGVKEAACQRSISYIEAGVDYIDDGSVTIDVRRVLDDKLRNGMRVEEAASGRFDHRWLVHATLKKLTWLKGSTGPGI